MCLPFNLTCTRLEIAFSSFVLFSLSSLAAIVREEGEREGGKGGRKGGGEERMLLLPVPLYILTDLGSGTRLG